jgi:hypothetical protein
MLLERKGLNKRFSHSKSLCGCRRIQPYRLIADCSSLDWLAKQGDCGCYFRAANLNVPHHLVQARMFTPSRTAATTLWALPISFAKHRKANAVP